MYPCTQNKCTFHGKCKQTMREEREKTHRLKGKHTHLITAVLMLAIPTIGVRIAIFVSIPFIFRFPPSSSSSSFYFSLSRSFFRQLYLFNQ